MGLLEQQSAYINLASKGVIGSKEITGTTKVSPAEGYYFSSITFIADSVVTAQEDVTNAINADLSNFTAIKAGISIYGKFASITLTSGEAIGYYSKK